MLATGRRLCLRLDRVLLAERDTSLQSIEVPLRGLMVIHAVTTAYRADINANGGAFGPRDDQWLTVASLVSQACVVPKDERPLLLDDAVHLAEELLGGSVVREAADFEWGCSDHPARMPSESILILADDIYQSGALHLGRALLDALMEADASLDTVQRGRVLAKRARIDARLGRIPEAADQYREVTRLARHGGSAELRVRAWIGHSALAQMRGNYPQTMRYSRRAAKLADRVGLRALGRLAHMGLMITAGAQHRFEDASRHAQIAYGLSAGNALREGEILQNIGQLLLEIGYVREAEGVFASVLSRALPIRIILPALGGLATAAASRGDVARVRWVYAELDRLRRMTLARSYDVASALLETASALGALGQVAEKDEALQAAVRIAESRGYHEFIVKADELRDARLAPAAGNLQSRETSPGLTSDMAMETADDLPAHVTLASAAI